MSFLSFFNAIYNLCSTPYYIGVKRKYYFLAISIITFVFSNPVCFPLTLSF